MASPSRPDPGNLPYGLTRLVGRTPDIAQLNGLAGSRLLVLVGPAGVGKTRLAVDFAAGRRSLHEGGAWFVDLSPLTSPSLLPELLAEVLGVGPGRDVDTLRALVATIGTRSRLIVLDNCEHLLEAVERTAGELLAACPQLHIVATSREMLQIPGAVRWPVQPLAVPEPEATTLGSIARSPAVELFAAAASLSLPGFTVEPANALTVAEICRRLDGLPLALELCASRVRMMPPGEILERLDNRFDLLTGGSRVAASRQRTLRATIDWSYELLDDSERALFRRLGVFSGSFDLEAAEAVVPGGPVPAVLLPLVTRLVDKSLVQPAGSLRGRARYRLLETVREYALERLAGNAEEETLRRQHARYYLELAELAAAPQEHRDQPDGDPMAADNGNQRAALDWALGADRRLFIGLTLALCGFWWVRGNHDDAALRLSQALELEPERTVERARLVNRLGFLAWRQGNYQAARSHLEECVAIVREVGDEALLAEALGGLGFVLFGGDDSSAARELFGEQLLIAERLGRDELVADAFTNLAIEALHAVDGERAAAAAEHSLAHWRRLGRDTPQGMVLPLKGLGLLLSGDLAGATGALHEGIRLRVRHGDRVLVATALEFAAELAARQGRGERAMRLAGMVDAIYSAAHATAPSLAVASRKRWIGPLRARLGRRGERLQAEGEGSTFEQAVAFALDFEALSPAVEALPNGSLSRRELEVAAQVARGLSNREVAARLRVSVRTIDSHLEHVRTKLGVSSRGEITNWIASQLPESASRDN